MNEALARLASAAGLLPDYWDGLGIRRELGEGTARALLAGLGFDPARPEAEHLAALETAAFATPLPPCVVLREGEPPETLVALPSGTLQVAWSLRLEDGTTRDGCVPVASCAVFDARGEVRRVRLPLPAGLPLGYHRLRLEAPAASAALIVAPARCHLPEDWDESRRAWGLAVQLYTLRSARNWGIGDFGDLARLAEAAGRAGADFLGINPLHARTLAHPDEASPYAPSSREFLDPVYIDVTAAPGFDTDAGLRSWLASEDVQARLAAARATSHVDYPSVTELKVEALARMHRGFEANADTVAMERFRAFRERGGAALAAFVAHEARRMQAERPSSADESFLAWLQWLAAEQLEAAARAASDAGMAIGLYRDLAVGAARGGAEVSAGPGLFADAVSVGAPPDLLNRQGQDWGLPPWNPRELAARGFEPLARLVAANMRAAGALRIDHVMALTRLFWIPRGMSGSAGGYVRYPFEALAAVVALESVRNRCLVIGEDLGSVPDGLRDALRDRGFLSYRVMIYERHWDGDGRFRHPEEYPRQALAMVATHDMAPLADYWRGTDVERRARLGLYPEPAMRDQEAHARHGERDGLVALLDALGLAPADRNDEGAVIAALHGAIGRTRSMLAAVQLDDVVGESEPVNIPGTHREWPNWRRKVALPLEAILDDPRWAALARSMREAGRGR